MHDRVDVTDIMRTTMAPLVDNILISTETRSDPDTNYRRRPRPADIHAEKSLDTHIVQRILPETDDF